MANFERESQRLHKWVERLQKQSEKLSSWRILAFCLSAGWGLIVGYLYPTAVWQIPTILGFLSFAILIYQQDRVDTTLELFKKRFGFAQRTQALAVLDWNAIPPLPPTPSLNLLPRYFSDLDLFSGHAVLRLLNQTVSTAGFARLIEHFVSNGISADVIRRRQEIAKEAEHLRVLRRRFFVVASLWTGLIESDRIRDLLEKPLHTPKAIPGFVVIASLQALFLGLFMLFSFQGGTPFFLGAALLLIVAYRFIGKEIELLGAYGYGMSLDTSLGKFSALSQVAGRMSATRNPHLRAMLEPFSKEHNPRAVLSRASRVVGFLGVKQNYILHIALNLLFPWDFYWTLRLERIRKEVKDKLPGWLETLSELEVFLSLAEFQATHPHYTFAEIAENAPYSLSCKGLGHPLISARSRVGNDLELNSSRRCVIITGSNMSGKSTFLRSLGVNLLLAKAGTVVCAKEFSLRPLDLATSLRLNDSLEDGLSSFYAEVKQLKTILDESIKGLPVFYLIDEVFRGTNNRERLIGSRAFVKQLAKTHAVGLITTHDLELSQLAEENPAIRNHHFKEDIDGDRMSFSYQLAEGPCPTTNALRVMQLAGLPIDEK